MPNDHKATTETARGYTPLTMEQIEALPPYTLEMTRPLLRAAVDAPWGQAMVMEEFAEANCFSTQVLPRAAAAKRK